MHIVSNISPSNRNAYGGGHFNKSGRAGFTLLQGHIQLMAMVPNLPENELSPRCRKSSSQESAQMPVAMESYECGKPRIMEGDLSSGPITPRLMPSASKFKRPHLPSILANKAAQNGFSSSWHPPRSPVVLPPTPSQPVTMPSFAKCLPGTRRAAMSRLQSSSCFPIIPNQPSYHAMSLVKEQVVEQQSPPTGNGGVYMNPYTCVIPPMGYQMMNFVPGSQQDLGASGDHPMFLPVQQQQCYEAPCSREAMYFPPNQNCMIMRDGGTFVNPTMLSYPRNGPYTAQSMPCFGTAYNEQNNGINNTYSMPNFNIHQTSQSRNGNVIILPPEPVEMSQGARPVYSASMPDICLPTGNSYVRNDQPQSCNSVPILCGNKGGNSIGVGTTSNNKEVSVLIEDSSSENEESCRRGNDGHSKGTSCSRTSLLKTGQHQPTLETSTAVDETRFSMLGPESLPTKIPAKPRVAHTPIRQQKCEEKVENNCSECECCSKCHKKSTKPTCNANPVKDNETNLTPRRKGKVVVAVHDCFPSDSSNTAEESEEDSARKACFNYTNNNSSVIRKRKPRIDAILHKAKARGDSSEEIFDDLNDLSPDEVRLYTCEYLTELLSSDDWSNNYIGLQTMVRMARHRPKTLLNYLGPILWYAFKHLTSPKSALCRAAIVTFKELFQRIGSALDNDLEKLTEKLVIKSLAPNKFIREECDSALEAMVNHCSLIKVLCAMDIVSKKPHVRAACQRISKMTKQFVQVAGVDTCLKTMYAEKLLPMLFAFMTEANNETRTAAKEALAMLMNHLQFETAVTKHVTFDRNCTEVFKKLDKMRGRNRNRGHLGVSRAHPLPHFRR